MSLSFLFFRPVSFFFRPSTYLKSRAHRKAASGLPHFFIFAFHRGACGHPVLVSRCCLFPQSPRREQTGRHPAPLRAPQGDIRFASRRMSAVRRLRASGWLVVAEDEGNEIPAPTPQHKMNIPENAVCSIICIDTFAYRAATDTRAVRKNVLLPAWMAALAEKRGVNCSQVLQDGLMQLFNASHVR